VTFRSEADAKNALHAIRGSKFEGKPVLARLKTESTHKSFYRYNALFSPKELFLAHVI
jgi:hypothetical protein